MVFTKPLILSEMGTLPGPKILVPVEVSDALNDSAPTTMPEERTAPAPFKNPRRDTSNPACPLGRLPFSIMPSNEPYILRSLRIVSGFFLCC